MRYYHTGFGTIDPTQKLDVQGDIRIRKTGNYSRIYFDAQTNDPGGILHYENDNNATLWLYPSDDWDANATNDYIVFGDANISTRRFWFRGDGTSYFSGNIGVGTTNPAANLHVADNSARARIQSTGASNNAGLNFQTANGTMWEVGKHDTNNKLYFSFYDGSWHEKVQVDTNGNMTCGGLVENNLQTPEEQQAESIDRFDEGDVLCWSPESDRLEKCTVPNDRLVMAVASPDGKPIVMGAEAIKVIGPVQAGDILVSSDVPGYAMVNNDPAPGTVIAQALEDFNGEQGVIKAMIRKW